MFKPCPTCHGAGAFVSEGDPGYANGPIKLCPKCHGKQDAYRVFLSRYSRPALPMSLLPFMLTELHKAEKILPLGGPYARAINNQIRHPSEPDAVMFSPEGVIIRSIAAQYGRYDIHNHILIYTSMMNSLKCMATVAWWQGLTKHSKVNKQNFIRIVEKLKADGLPPEPEDV